MAKSVNDFHPMEFPKEPINKQAFRQGWFAAADGKALEDNPYQEEDKQKRDWWEDGFKRQLWHIEGLNLGQPLTKDEWIRAAYDCLKLGAELMPLDQLRHWEGVRTVLELAPIEELDDVATEIVFDGSKESREKIEKLIGETCVSRHIRPDEPILVTTSGEIVAFIGCAVIKHGDSYKMISDEDVA